MTNPAQFSNAAREWHRIEQRDPNANIASTLRILGPNFSTSLLTLNSLLEGELCPDLAAKAGDSQTSSTCIQAAQVISGTVSANPTFIHHNLKGLSRAQFFSLNESAAASQEMLLDYLRTSEHIQCADIALLSEDQTAYGGFILPSRDNDNGDTKEAERTLPDCNPLMLHFPREISQLRNAYEKNSILKNPSSNQNSNAAKQSLDLNLEDSHQQEDDVPSFSADQDAISEESTLGAITRELYNRRVRVAVLSATDALDTIFVAQFLRNNLPNARIVISDADLLFARASQAHNFRGMLTVTTYPLIGNSVDWGGRFLQGSTEYSDAYGAVLPDRVFPDQDATGIYNAMRLLVMSPLQVETGKGPVSVSKAGGLSVWLYGYNDPFEGGNRPPL